MKQILLKNGIREITGCVNCPVKYNDGEYYDDLPACGLVKEDNDVILYAREREKGYPYWCPLEDKV